MLSPLPSAFRISPDVNPAIPKVNETDKKSLSVFTSAERNIAECACLLIICTERDSWKVKSRLFMVAMYKNLCSYLYVIKIRKRDKMRWDEEGVEIARERRRPSDVGAK